MRIVAMIFLALLSITLAAPALLLFVDVWTWLVLGSGITPIDWTFVGTNSHTDSIGKPILAVLFLGPSFLTMVGALSLGSKL